MTKKKEFDLRNFYPNSFTSYLKVCTRAKPHVVRNSAGSDIEGVEVIHGLENIIRLIVQSTNSVKESLDICADHTWPKVQIETGPITQAYTALKKTCLQRFSSYLLEPLWTFLSCHYSLFLH